MPNIQQVKDKQGRPRSLTISIPFEFARLKGWRKGDVLVFGTDSRSGLVTLDKLREPVKEQP